MDGDLAGVPFGNPQAPGRVGPDPARALSGGRWLDDRRLVRRPVDLRDVAARERRVPDIAHGCGGNAVRPATARRVERLDLALGRVKAAVHAWLAGEPQDAIAVERRRVEVRVGMAVRQLEDLDLVGHWVDADDRVETAVGDPRGTLRSDDHPVRRGPWSEIDLANVAGRRIEVAKRSNMLAGVPDATVDRGRDVVRVAAHSDGELLHLPATRCPR